MAHAAQPCPKGVGGSQVENIDRRMKISWCCSGLLFRELKRSLLCLTGTIKPFQMLTPTKARVSDAKDFNKAPSTKCVLAAAGDGPGSVPAAPKAMQPGGGDHESSKKKRLAPSTRRHGFSVYGCANGKRPISYGIGRAVYKFGAGAKTMYVYPNLCLVVLT